MSQLELTTFTAPMLSAFRGVLGHEWPVVASYVQQEIEQAAQELQGIQTDLHNGDLSPVEAQTLIAGWKNNLEADLMGAQGLAQLALQRACNAAFDAVRAPINTALGVALL